MTLKNALIVCGSKTVCIDALWRNGIQDDTLHPAYLMNRKAHVTVKTAFGDFDPFITTDLLIGPILNNCSLSDICTEGKNFMDLCKSNHWNLLTIKQIQILEMLMHSRVMT